MLVCTLVEIFELLVEDAGQDPTELTIFLVLDIRILHVDRAYCEEAIC